MKKILSLLLMLAMGLSLCACVAQPPQPQCIHIWKSATCKDVKTCTKCGEMQGGLVAHNYSERVLGFLLFTLCDSHSKTDTACFSYVKTANRLLK